MSIPKKRASPEENNFDLALRPITWQDYVGQEKVKRHLRVIIEAAKKRRECCDHLLFYGQAGLGKTTLSYLVAKEMGAEIKTTSGPALEKAGDLAAILSNLEANNILFIDEAHRLNKMIEEVLYPAMESRKLHLVIGKGPAARTLSLDLPPFTLVAATTKINLLSAPLRSRFGATFKLDYYEPEDIERILNRSAKLLGVAIEPAAIKVLAGASRFTPRVANRLLRRCRDYAQVKGQNVIDEALACRTLEFLEVDNLGLEAVDRLLLEAMIRKFNGGPVGVKALAASLGEEPGTIEDVYEPFLMRIGFLQRTPAGRIAAQAAYRHLGIETSNTLI